MASEVKRSGGLKVLSRVLAAIEKGQDQAVVVVALKIERQSVREVPVDNEVLRTSRTVNIDRSGGRGKVKVDISYGTKYALVQHERLDFKHNPPTKAKYLSDPFDRHAPTLKDEIKTRVQKNIRKVLLGRKKVSK